ncbi:MAG: hypothetical protein ACRYG7_37440 [Janthinobacterium lividum]
MRKLLLLAPVLLLASCHSEQVVLQAQSAVSEPITTASTPTIFLDSTLTATVVAARPATADYTPAALPTKPPKHQAPPVPRLHRAGILQPLATLAKAAVVAPSARQLAHRLPRPRPTEGTAESGLGRVALFFIGVVLAVLAGLAALVNVIFGVGFFTALGYTAAGLVVLFLLYSLLSGGKKKK